MCKKDKHTIIELRSEDATVKLGGTNAQSTVCRFALPLRDIFRDHPGNDKGLWNVRVCYFGFYQAKGITNSGTGIDISIDQLSSPFIFSSRRQPKLILATANADICNDIDNAVTSAFLPCGYYLGNDEAYETTCRVAFTDWTVRIDNAQDGDGSETKLRSDFGVDAEIEDWVLRLEITPYDPSHEE